MTQPEQAEAAPAQEPIFSLPNLLTLVRLPMALAAWALVQWPWALAALMAAAAGSDMLDGWFARRVRKRRRAKGLPTRGLGEKGGRGAWLDPCATRPSWSPCWAPCGGCTSRPGTCWR
ncbi:MAG: CDP-alcohol phosphatidyltransferase family protein [Planctomycetota bacterium]|nr:CDP-alcohol phosphatidyltransferase family protein [Planctomycetota bacterium]